MTHSTSASVAILAVIMIIFNSCNDNEPGNSPFERVYSQTVYASISDSIRKSPRDAALYYRRGLRLHQNNVPEAALYDFKKAWGLDKKEEYGVAAANLMVQFQPDSAIIFLHSALEQHESVFFRLSLAKAYAAKNNAKASLQQLDTILQKWPGAIDALMMKAELLEMTGGDAEALKALEQAYTLNPADVELSYALAFRYAESKNPKALALSDSLIRMDTSETHAEPYYFKGVYYSNTGNTSQALHFFNEAIAHDYHFLDSYLEKGRIFYNQKKYADAFKVFQLAATITPSYADAYFWMGKVQEALNDKEEAKLNYLRAYGLDKTLTEARDAAARL